MVSAASAAFAEDFPPTAEINDLPAWMYQTAESKLKNGIIRTASRKCQMPAGEVPCQLFLGPMTVKELGLTGLTITELDNRNELIDLLKIVEETGFVPSMIWFD